MTAGRIDFAMIRERIDLARLADDEGLAPRRRAESGALTFTCPSCRRRLRDRHFGAAMSVDLARWSCVRCDAKGDVVDLLEASRSCTRDAAIKLACELAGVDDKTGQPSPGDVWRPRPSPILPSAPELPAEERALRLRSVRLAALHYRYLAGFVCEADGEDSDTPSPEEHARFLVEVAGWPAAKARNALEAREVCIAYLRRRLGSVSWDDALPMLVELVGVCSARDTGLREHLQILGGAALVGGAERAGLFLRPGPGGWERFGGCLVYQWTDLAGRVSYLAGRAVDELHDGCRRARDDNGKPIKAEALPVYAPDRRGDDRGVYPPVAPFGAHVAARLEGAVLIVEGEMDAIHELVEGPAVATGGTGRMLTRRGVEAIRASLDGRSAIVVPDSESDPAKQTETNERAQRLAHALGAQWRPGEVVP